VEAQNPQKQPPTSPQKNKDLLAKLNAAKSTLGLRDLNVSAAATGHEKFLSQAAKTPNAPVNQILNKLSSTERKNYMAVSSHVPSDSLGQNVPMNKFRRQLQVLKPSGSQKPLMNSYDVLDKDQFCEATLKDETMPPPMLVLKRTGIRIFPDGRRVAMYVNSRLGLVFTIPYKGSGTQTEVLPGVQAEEVEHEEIMESLDQVAKYAQEESPKQTSRHMKFNDGSKLKVSHGAAKAIHMVHGALNDENKKKFADMLASPKGFEKAAHFALSKVQFTIGGK